MSLLEISLDVVVPLWIEEMKTWPEDERLRVARESAQVVAEHGDDILYRSRRKGATAAAFNALARGIAALAFVPGGVKVFGQHWEVKP